MPCAATPLHLPHLIGPMQHYLWILKTTHSGADMDTSMEMAKGFLDDGLRWTIYDILKNRQALLEKPSNSQCLHQSLNLFLCFRLSLAGVWWVYTSLYRTQGGKLIETLLMTALQKADMVSVIASAALREGFSVCVQK